MLRKHPDVIGVGEMRSAKEALSVAESSRTGHTVVTTIHSNSSESTYRRMMTLAKRKYNMADDILMQIMVEAYPIVVFTKQLEDGSRKIMQIIEGEDYRNGKLCYRPLTNMMWQTTAQMRTERLRWLESTNGLAVSPIP